MLFFAALLVPTAPAQAAYSVLCTGYTSCDGKGYSHGGYAANKSKSYWNMYTGTNCTNYVAYRLVATNGLPNKRPKPGVGNARDWGKAMSSVTDNVPTKGSVAWWGKTGNHVAYVEKVVSPTEVWVSESNWSGAFDWRKITKSGSGWPDGFIHFSDPKLVNTAKPAISATPKVGQKVKATGGTWSPTGNSYAYQWLAGGTAIKGATSATFVPAAAHTSKKLTVRVTASRAGYPTVKATSAEVGVQAGTFTWTKNPVVTGVAQVDTPLVASSGTVTPAPTLAYQWFADDVEIAGASGASFSPAADHVGRNISVRVRSTAPGYKASARTIRVASPVALGQPQSDTAPRILGPATVGSRLTASPGAWSGSGLTFAYQWRAAGIAIAGATTSTYTVGAADRGKAITVQVTAKGPGYVSVSNVSAATAAVSPGTFTLASRPAISGTARVGGRLTASVGTWTPAADSYLVQWFAGQSAITGATSLSYQPVARDLGQQLSVRIQPVRAGFGSAVAYSPRAASVATGAITHSANPRVLGTPRTGTVLQVDPGTYSPAGAKVSYQWLRDGKSLSGSTGRTRRVSTNDVGHRLTAKVTYRASSYDTRSVTVAARGTAKSFATISAKAARPGPGQVTFALKVSAAGVKAPGGTMSIRRGTKLVGQVKIKTGKGTVKLTKQPAGRQTYQLTFEPTSSITRSSKLLTVTVG